MNFNVLAGSRRFVAGDLEKDLGSFVRAAWPTLHPGSKLVWNWHLDLLCEYLELVRRRQIIRLIINVPPRTAKSSVAAIAFPVFCWLQDPKLSFLCASYEIDLAGTHNLERRRLIMSTWFQNLFADRFKLSADRSLVEEFTNASGGRMLAASTNSRAMGRGGDIVIVDDPLSADVAHSDILRNEVNQWFVHMLPQRLNDPATSPIVVVMQRLHEADPTGFLLESEPGEWTHLKLPLIAEEHEKWIFPVSGRVVKRRAGDCLDPKRFPKKVIQQRQRNRLVFAGQFQQNPAPLEGNLIRTADIQYYGGRDPVTGQLDADLPTSFDRKIISVDCSFKDKATSDYVAILTIGIKGPRRYILSAIDQHLDLDGTEQAILREHSVFGPVSAVLVEDKANGSAVISHLKEKVSGLIALNPQGGKVARVAATAPEFQANDWIIDRTAPWVNSLVSQLTMFPNAKHDDLVDAVSQAAIYLQQNSFELGLIAFYKQKAVGIAQGVLRLAAPSKSGTPAVFEPVVPSPTAVLDKDTAKTLACPECKSALVQSVSNFYRCGQCATQWWPNGKAPAVNYGPSRKDVLSGRAAGLRNFPPFISRR